MSEYERLLKILREDRSLDAALVRLVKLLGDLERSGLLDLLEALASKRVLHRLYDFALSTGLLRLADRVDSLLQLLSDVSDELEKPVREEEMRKELMELLSDPAVEKGLVKLLRALRAVGLYSPS